MANPINSKGKHGTFTLNRVQAQMVADALEILDPDTDEARNMRAMLVIYFSVKAGELD